MNVVFHSLEPRFDPRTGKPVRQAVTTQAGWICDYCGKFHSEEEHGRFDIETTYQINEVGGSEPQFDGLKVRGYEKEINTYDLFEEHPEFCYCQNFYEDQLCERDMLVAAAQGAFGDLHLICNVLYQARCEMLAKVLAQGRFSLANFGLADPEELEIKSAADPTAPSVTANFESVPPKKFRLLHVRSEMTLCQLVEEEGLPYIRGNGFYLLTEREKISAQKTILLREPSTGFLFTGDGVRNYLGLPTGANSSLSPKPALPFDVYVQTTSKDRGLLADTTVLYRLP